MGKLESLIVGFKIKKSIRRFCEKVASAITRTRSCANDIHDAAEDVIDKVSGGNEEVAKKIVSVATAGCFIVAGIIIGRLGSHDIYYKGFVEGVDSVTHAGDGVKVFHF